MPTIVEDNANNRVEPEGRSNEALVPGPVTGMPLVTKDHATDSQDGAYDIPDNWTRDSVLQEVRRNGE